MDIKRENIESYLQSRFGPDLKLLRTSKMGETIPTTEDVKGFGYGAPLMLEYTQGGKLGSVVLSTMRVQYGFGHDHFSDRAQILIWQNATFGKLPKHVHSQDVGYFTDDGRLVSSG
ncbi:MAG TPA: aminoglycoside phosphotransferase family protein, partial [Methanotrichaceae archaeon]|nr:aminoglycoside phosphotransferase family protein [Methanotrichaceae archaeon]